MLARALQDELQLLQHREAACSKEFLEDLQSSTVRNNVCLIGSMLGGPWGSARTGPVPPLVTGSLIGCQRFNLGLLRLKVLKPEGSFRHVPSSKPQLLRLLQSSFGYAQMALFKPWLRLPICQTHPEVVLFGKPATVDPPVLLRCGE